MDPQQRLLLETRGRRSSVRGSTRRRCAAARPACSSARSATATTACVYGRGAARRRGLHRHRQRGQRRVGPRRLHLGPGGPGDDAWTRRAPRRWWRCTWRARRCARGSATLALAGGVTVMATPGCVRRVQPPARLAPRRALQGVLCRGRRHGLGGGRGHAGARAPVGRAAPRPRVLAVVRGSAVNQDGAQQRADGAQRSLAAAGDPAGAGAMRGCPPRESMWSRRTARARRLGDPIEAQALLATYGQDGAAEHRCGLGRSSRTSVTRRPRRVWQA